MKVICLYSAAIVWEAANGSQTSCERVGNSDGSLSNLSLENIALVWKIFLKKEFWMKLRNVRMEKIQNAVL